MKQIDFNKEMAEVKLKVMENGINIPLVLGTQIRQVEFAELKGLSKNYLLQNLRRLQNAFNEFEDPDIPELNDYGVLTRQEVYFLVRAAYMYHVEKEKEAELAKLIEARNEMKTRAQKRKEVDKKIADLSK